MDEVQQGPQYALHIAVHTLRDRCKHLQQHVALLEQENVNLKTKCSQHEEYNRSINEVDYLRTQVAELSEQKEQLHNKVKLVTNENQDLWGKLTQLTKVNTSLGNQLAKISDTLTQHTTAQNSSSPHHNLIRSKTFTKSELQTKVLHKNLEDNDRISLELEDISLKLSDSFNKQRKELDVLCSEISELIVSSDELVTDNCGFLFDEELENDIFAEIESYGEDLKLLKAAVEQQQTVLELNVKNIQLLKEKLQCKLCQCKKQKIEKSTSTLDLATKTFDNKYTETDNPGLSSAKATSPNAKNNLTDYTDTFDRVCPLCSKVYQKDVDFSVFETHVEGHFILDEGAFELL